MSSKKDDTVRKLKETNRLLLAQMDIMRKMNEIQKELDQLGGLPTATAAASTKKGGKKKKSAPAVVSTAPTAKKRKAPETKAKGKEKVSSSSKAKKARTASGWKNIPLAVDKPFTLRNPKTGLQITVGGSEGRKRDRTFKQLIREGEKAGWKKGSKEREYVVDLAAQLQRKGYNAIDERIIPKDVQHEAMLRNNMTPEQLAKTGKGKEDNSASELSDVEATPRKIQDFHSAFQTYWLPMKGKQYGEVGTR